MKITFYGDSLTEGKPGISYLKILQNKLPDYELINYGKGGDTVVSLQRRIVRERLDQSADIALVWIGVNDIYVKVAWYYPIFHTLFKQPWAKTIEEFQQAYRSILDLLSPKVAKIITVSPLFIGEDFDNPWNQELTAISQAIEQVSAHYQDAEFIDLRSIFAAKLAGKKISDYTPTHLIDKISDALWIRHPDQVDQRAAERNLLFTFDGDHLNSKGAEIIAEVFMDVITCSR